MLLSSVDWALRGGTVALVLLIATTLLRDYGGLLAARLTALFAVGTGTYAITSVAGFSPQLGLWTVPLLALSAGNNVVFWTLAASLFDDGFRLRWWHGALWLLLVVAGIAGCSCRRAPLGIALTLSSLAFAALAMARAVASWRADLVEGRRRLRLFVVGASSLYIGASPWPSSPASSARRPKAPASAAHRPAGHRGHRRLVAARRRPRAIVVRRHGPAATGREPRPAVEPGDQELVAKLERLMTVERAHRQDGLTIGGLAQQLGLPEYRLRRLINQALGYRNFNSFVNRYRIAEVKAALADPNQADVPVLTLALDAGFSSLGPFNRAFKAETGVTPSEYRRVAGIGQPISESASPLSNSARSNLAAH